MTALSRAGLAVALMIIPGPSLTETITFSTTPLDGLPVEFRPARTGKGAMGAWRVVEEVGGRRVLEQGSMDATDYRFPLAIYQALVPRDLEVSIRFKAISGKVDQAGGVAVRLRDPNNYYVVRANALEDNVRFYRVVNGTRQELAGAN